MYIYIYHNDFSYTVCEGDNPAGFGAIAGFGGSFGFSGLSGAGVFSSAVSSVDDGGALWFEALQSMFALATIIVMTPSNVFRILAAVS